jgi:light-regulated signal transduction histidine kinase (bacteriophytochrome)
MAESVQKYNRVVIACAVGSAYFARTRRFQTADTDILLGLFSADHAIVSIRNSINIYGDPSEQEMIEVRKLIDFFKLEDYHEITSCVCLKEQSERAKYIRIYCGFLFIPLSQNNESYIAFLRKERIRVFFHTN